MQQVTGVGAFTDATANIINSNFNQIPWGGIITGNVIYLDPANTFQGSSDTNTGLSPQSACLTLAGAYAKLRSGYNDGIVLLANGATSSTARLSANFTWAKSAAHFFGACAPTLYGQRARVAPATTATAFANFFTVSGIGCVFANLEFFQGFTAGVAAEIAMTITGARNVFLNCQITAMVDTDAAGAQSATSRHLKIGTSENYFSHCVIGEDTVTRINANASIEFYNGAGRNVFEDCILPAYGGAGGAPVFIKTAATNSMDRENIFRRCLFLNAIGSAATAMTAAITLNANSGGLIVCDAGTGFVGCTAIADSTSKAQTYLIGPATSGASGIGVVVT